MVEVPMMTRLCDGCWCGQKEQNAKKQKATGQKAKKQKAKKQEAKKPKAKKQKAKKQRAQKLHARSDQRADRPPRERQQAVRREDARFPVSDRHHHVILIVLMVEADTVRLP